MVKIRDVDRGWRKMKNTTRRLSLTHSRVDVGLFKDQGGEILRKAWMNEFGDGDRLPERSFFRTAADENRAVIIRKLKAAKMDLIRGRVSSQKFLSKLGKFGVNMVRKKILTGPFVANHRSTLRNKFPETRPLIHTKDMLRGINRRVRR